jgi:very-short-patch-repair endonuclease
MTSGQVEGEGPTDKAELKLADRILAALQRQPAQKAADLAQLVGADRREVNRCLRHDLAGMVIQDLAYRWTTVTQSGRGPNVAFPTPQGELGRLCRYFLDCIGQDSDKGVSTPASSNQGNPQYVELYALPFLQSGQSWWTRPGVEQVLASVRADPAKLTAWIGYPVRLREHRPAAFYVEPILLWQIVIPEKAGDAYQLANELPVPNFAALRSFSTGEPNFVVQEVARLEVELGLNNPVEDRPEVDEVVERLVRIRPDWDWREVIDPDHLSTTPPLSSLGRNGIYNRAIVIPAERSPYTMGLEAELKTLGDTPEEPVRHTALGRWLSGDVADAGSPGEQPLIEVLPMNTEQRAALAAALSAQLTVVTGPPGTGKSQVVTNLLINAAWQGMKVLFASKNNKAVNVVEARVNGMGNRPVLLRLGSGEYQAKLAEYLTAMLSGTVSEDDRVSYQEGLERHKLLLAKADALERQRHQTMEARNLVDRLEAEVDPLRSLFPSERFNALDSELLEDGQNTASVLTAAIDAVDPKALGFFGRIALWLTRKSRHKRLRTAADILLPVARHMGLIQLEIAEPPDLQKARLWLSELARKDEAARRILDYQAALDTLRHSPPLEDIARDALDLKELIAGNSSHLWRDWVQLTPSRLNPVQRRDIADYTALLQLLTGPDAVAVNSAVKRRARELQQKVTALFSCWAVTSLSARGKVPFNPGEFDLVVIDEASQCDIASALPLLYRAKRAVIIGDPMQLRHISALGRAKDSDLQNRYGLVESRPAWMYSVNSLYDLAAGIAGPHQIINLRDHHRCHADIISFSNKAFYGGRLRVATRYSTLKRRSNNEPGIIWQDVRGNVTRPGNSSARNVIEANAVCAALHDLLVVRGYNGTVGVVTPFRSQVQLLEELVARSETLMQAAPRAELLVDSVHGFQGDERDVMFFSPVVSEGMSPGALSFLRSNGNLFNVAITRARGLLYVVGDRAAASNSGVDYLEQFSEYVSGLDLAREQSQDQKVGGLGSEYPTVSQPERVSEWERVLYRALYAAGVRAIPQYSVEQYDLDFAVVAGDRRLNIEVDGERYHRSWTGELCIRDQLRNQRLIELGWEVKRFWVYELRDRMSAVVQSVVDWQNKQP